MKTGLADLIPNLLKQKIIINLFIGNLTIFKLAMVMATKLAVIKNIRY